MLYPEKPVHVLSVGPFGQAVARYLTTLRHDVSETVVINNVLPLPETWPVSRMRLLVSWRPVPSLCQLLEETTFSSCRPFLPLMLDSTAMRIGPVVVPGSGCCWSCWVKRWRQHSEWPEAHSALLGYYASHPDNGPAGFLESFALIGAARLTEIIEEIDSSEVQGGSMWQINLLTREIVTGVAIGFHDCPRCGLRREAAKRSYSGLQRELAYLWTHNSAEGR